MNNKCMQMNDKCLVLEIPLLFEANFTDLCTEIWFIKCSKNTQLKRVMNRDKISEEEARRIIDSQSNDIDKEKLSDVVICSDEDNQTWQTKINQLI